MRVSDESHRSPHAVAHRFGRFRRLGAYLAVTAAVATGGAGAATVGPIIADRLGVESATPTESAADVGAADSDAESLLDPLPEPDDLLGGGDETGEAVDLQDGTTLAPWEMKDGVKEFQLNVAPLSWQTAPDKDAVEALAVNGQIPAPTIRVNEGDEVRFVVKNEMDEDTSIHWHGMDLPNDQDGVPHLTQEPIEPGETFTYEWTAISTGTHWYHTHMDGDQLGRGLYGSLEVVPTFGDIDSDRDYRIILGDGALGFVFNGKSFPATAQLKAKVGERVRIRLIGSGPEMHHPIHLHGGYFEVVAQDGHRLPTPERRDTILVGVGQTYDLIWTPTRPGEWMIHCHIFSHSETREGMTGMVSIFNVDPATIDLPSLPGLPD